MTASVNIAPAEEFSWPNLVHHVLAHLDLGPIPATASYDGYVRWVVANTKTVPSGRTLGADLDALRQIMTTHRLAAEVQRVAVLHQTIGQAESLAAHDLCALSEPTLRQLGIWQQMGEVSAEVLAGAELLRCAALLELPVFSALPDWPLAEGLQSALDEASEAAPHLLCCRVVPLSSLGPHGRLCDDIILIGRSTDRVGAPATNPAPRELAWQAAHEATLAEVLNRSVGAGPLGERDAERVALVLLAMRAGRCGQEAPHQRWAEARSIPPVWLLIENLDRPGRDRVRACLE